MGEDMEKRYMEIMERKTRNDFLPTKSSQSINPKDHGSDTITNAKHCRNTKKSKGA